MTTLFGRAPKDSYKELLKLNTVGVGLGDDLVTVMDGNGQATGLKLSKTQIAINELLWPASGTAVAGQVLAVGTDGASLEWVTLDLSGAGGGATVDYSSVTTALGYVPEDPANKGVADGYAGLDSNGLISTTLMPTVASYVGYTPEDTANKNSASGYAGLDSNGKLTTSLLPSVSSYIGYTPENVANKNVANGYVGLGSDGKVPSSYLPSTTLNNTFVVTSQSEQTALSAAVGDIAVRTDQNKSYVLKATPASTFSNWQELLSSAAVTSVNSQTGNVSLTSSNISEGSNLYFTNARSRSAFSITAGSSGVTYSSSTGVLDFSNLQTSSGAVTSVNGQTGTVVLSTSDIAEGSNQYYTTSRARSALSVTGTGLSYNSTTGVITISGLASVAGTADGQIQYKSGSSLAANQYFKYDTSTYKLTVGGATLFSDPTSGSSSTLQPIAASGGYTLNVVGGDSSSGAGAGGALNLKSGLSGATGSGADITVTASSAGLSGTGAGGDVALYAGTSRGTNQGGSIDLFAGTGPSTGGDVSLNAGASNTLTPGASIKLYGNGASTANGGVFVTLAATTNAQFVVRTTASGGATTDRFMINKNGAFYVNGGAGTSGQILTSAGVGSAPSWTSISKPTGATGVIQLTDGSSNFVGDSDFKWLTDTNELVVGTSATPASVHGRDGDTLTSISANAPGAAITLRAGVGGSYSSTDGGAVGGSLTLTAGNGGAGHNTGSGGNGGSVVIAAGAKGGAQNGEWPGTDGTLQLKTGGSVQLQINGSGAWQVGGVTGTNGQVLTSNGSGVPTWSNPATSGTVTSVAVSGGTTGLTTSGGPITGSGTITLAGTLAIANGGTGATTAAGARTALGLATVAATGAYSDLSGAPATLSITAGSSGVTYNSGTGVLDFSALSAGTPVELYATGSATRSSSVTNVSVGVDAASAPIVSFVNAAAPAGAKVSQIQVNNSGNWQIGFVNDAISSITTWLDVSRSSNTATNITLTGTAITLTGSVTGTSFSGNGASLTSLNASNLASGTVATARLGSGTASSSTYLRGDGTWAAVSGDPEASQTITSTSATTLATLDASVVRGFKATATAIRGTAVHMTEFLVIHDGTTAYITEYGTVMSGSALGTFDAVMSGGNILVQFTSGSATSTKVNLTYKTLAV